MMPTTHLARRPSLDNRLKGMELDVKLGGSGRRKLGVFCFAATAFDVQVAAATTSRQHTLNKGSRTSHGRGGGNHRYLLTCLWCPIQPWAICYGEPRV